MGEGLYSEQRSKFLAFAHHVESVEEAMSIVAHYREQYYDARHCCFAYRIGPAKDIFRVYDDGEPSSTAGKPILGQIASADLTDILICVIRYFGGVKLGSKRLTIAYKAAAAEAIAHCTIEEKVLEETVSYTCPYHAVSHVMRVARNFGASLADQRYGEQCTLDFSIKKSQASALADYLKELYIPPATET